MRTMKMKFLILLAVVAPLFVACDPNDDEVEVVVPKISTGAYILNQGKFGANNASLSYYNFADSTVTADIFSAANDRGLGDTGQDIIIYGSNLYIAVYNSSLIEVIDVKTGFSKRTIPLLNDASAPRSPRSLVAYNGKVYVTLYDGHVAQLDTTSFTVEKLLSVGANPEGIVAANNLLYVANSGGMAAKKDSTISVIDPATFKELRKIKVVINPDKLVADSQGDVYVISKGNYADIPATLQRISANSEVVTSISNISPYNMTINNDNIYIYSYEYDANWSVVNKKYIKYNANSESVENGSFIPVDAVAKVPFSIDIDPTNGDIYLAESDYKNAGKMYVFTSNGEIKASFNVGLNAAKTVFVIK